MKIRILLCDDATFIRDLIKRTLRKFLPQCEIVEASDGKKAQSILSKQTVDLILSDWEMPEVSGEELLLWTREHEKHANTPFIMITSLGDKNHIMKAVQGGVTDYLGKPFTGEELMQKVRKALARVGKLPAAPGAARSSGGGPFSSAELLNTGRPDAALAAAATEALTGGGKASANNKLRGTGLIRWGEKTLKCMIKSISIEEVVLVIKRPDAHPQLLESLLLDILPGNDAERRIGDVSCHLHSIAAVERKIDAEFFNLVLRYSGPDETQRAQIADFVLSAEAG